MLTLIAALVELSGGQASFVPTFEPARLGELPRSCLNVARAHEVLGWSAQTEFIDGLRITLAAAQ